MEHLTIELNSIELDIEGKYLPGYDGSTFDEPIDAEFETLKVIYNGTDVTELLNELFVSNGDGVLETINEICVDKF